ncbi:hypothetical protein BDF20DRAFT_893274 [Mycotypha africana]|uniref:uncharacterized protein n=1 Tax=Mycotypha africana TaxID=64632 RepID=UPI00230000AB|nr:uncharacterized protein BDF20DRAFT_893274 [Mycotypha africana]KAI8969108.1 hypothetical protein BDF20DRAFT_893274 [Mycotypha africana]
MTLKSTNSDFSYRLTESILSASTSQPSTVNLNAHHHNQSKTARLVTNLPPNSVVVHPKDNDSAFNTYLGDHFKEDAQVLLDRLSVITPVTSSRNNNNNNNNDQRKISNVNLWTSLSNNEAGSQPRKLVSIRDDNPWHDYDIVFQGNHKPPYHERLRHSPDSLHSFGAFLFLFGFLCPPLWWLGSFYPFKCRGEETDKDVEMKMMKKWRTLNRFLSLGFSTLLIVVVIILLALYKSFRA